MPPWLGDFGDARRQAIGVALLERLVEVGQSGVIEGNMATTRL
jgi:hypothetical protein